MHFEGVFYRYTQRTPLLGWIFVALTIGVFIVSLAYPAVPYVLMLAPLFLIAWLLYTLTTHTVEVAPERIILWFGLPIDKISFNLEDVLEYRRIDIPTWRGTGLYKPHEKPAWLFGFRSPQGLQLELKSGQQVVIGTDRPDELAAALMRATLVSRAR